MTPKEFLESEGFAEGFERIQDLLKTYWNLAIKTAKDNVSMQISKIEGDNTNRTYTIISDNCGHIDTLEEGDCVNINEQSILKLLQ